MPAFAPALEAVGRVPLRTLPQGFAGLARIVVGQQVSTAAARSIFARLEAGLPALAPEAVLAASEERLRACGLSGPKLRTLKALSAAVADDGLDIAALAGLPDAAVAERLTAVKGIGPWTAEIYLIFALRRADVWPAGDLALQKALGEVMRLRRHPDAARCQRLSRRWRPLRTVAAHLLWAYYNQGAAMPVDPVPERTG